MTQPQSPAPVIAMNRVTHAFGEDTGVFDLSVAIPPGVIFGLIGPSGCGKTTTVRLLTGVLKPQRGDLSVLGEPPSRFHTRTRERIGYMPQQFVLYPNLTVDENMNFVAALYGIGWLRRRKVIPPLLDFVELRDARRRLASRLSGGMQRRLELAGALVNDPAILFADEPTAGIDPVLRAKVWDQFRALRSQGRTLFVTTQYVGEAAYCDYVGVMRAGRLLYVDTPANLRKRAMGGDVIELLVDQPHALDVAQLLQRQTFVSDVRRSRVNPSRMFIYVDDAATCLPPLLDVVRQQSDATIERADPYNPPFDDVFVALLEQAGNADAEIAR